MTTKGTSNIYLYTLSKRRFAPFIGKPKNSFPVLAITSTNTCLWCVKKISARSRLLHEKTTRSPHTQKPIARPTAVRTPPYPNPTPMMTWINQSRRNGGDNFEVLVVVVVVAFSSLERIWGVSLNGSFPACAFFFFSRGNQLPHINSTCMQRSKTYNWPRHRNKQPVKSLIWRRIRLSVLHGHRWQRTVRICMPTVDHVALFCCRLNKVPGHVAVSLANQQ